MSEQYNAIFAEIQAHANPEAVKGMARFGIKPEKVFGLSMPLLREMGRKIPKNHALALELWDKKFRETMILAALVDEPALVTDAQMESWVSDFYDWEICDQTIMNLFEKLPGAWQKAFEWADRSEEFVKRAGFVLMARLAISDKKADDQLFLPYLPIIIRDSVDSRNFVKKAINWALRQIGKRSLFMNAQALETAYTIQKLDSASARWVGADAIRELTDQKILSRIHSREKF